MLLRVLTYSAVLFLIVFSIGVSFAATDSNGVQVPDLVPATYVPKVYKDTPVPCMIGVQSTLNASACASAIRSYSPGSEWKYVDGSPTEMVPRVFSSLVSGSLSFKPGVNSSGTALYCGLTCQKVTFSYSGTSAQYTEGYTCPPVGYPEHIITENTQCRIKQCPKDQAKLFDGVDMENGAGYACNAGCETQIFKPSTTKGQFGWQFIGTTTGSVCKCVNSDGSPTGSLNCWFRGYSDDGSGSGTDKTCSAYDQGELKGVNCGENGSMDLDLGPINDSLVGLSQANIAQDKTLNEHSVQLGNHQIALDNITSRMDSGEFKGEKGDTGPAGEKGETGEKGVNGAAGQAGADGKDGVNGRDGVDGQNGTNGKDGEKGEKGEKGDAGEAGAAGATGAAGRDGVDGQNGTDGAQGLQGIQGLQGEKGDTGEDGDSVLAVQDGIDVHMVNARTGARMATLKGIDRDGIIDAVDQSTNAIKDLTDTLNISAPTESENPFKDIFGDADISALEQQIVQAQTDFSTLVGQAGSRLNIGSVSGGGSYAADVHDIKGQQVDLSGGALFEMLVANGAATIVSLLFSLIGFGVLLGGNKK